MSGRKQYWLKFEFSKNGNSNDYESVFIAIFSGGRGGVALGHLHSYEAVYEACIIGPFSNIVCKPHVDIHIGLPLDLFLFVF